MTLLETLQTVLLLGGALLGGARAQFGSHELYTTSPPVYPSRELIYLLWLFARSCLLNRIPCYLRAVLGAALTRSLHHYPSNTLILHMLILLLANATGTGGWQDAFARAQGFLAELSLEEKVAMVTGTTGPCAVSPSSLCSVKRS